MTSRDVERYRSAVRELRCLARLRSRRLKSSGIEEPAITRAATGDIELAFQYLGLGCHVGDMVVCRSRGMEDRIASICGFLPAIIAFADMETARLPKRIMPGYPRAVLILGLEGELAEGRGCSSSAIERIDADEFVYLG